MDLLIFTTSGTVLQQGEELLAQGFRRRNTQIHFKLLVGPILEIVQAARTDVSAAVGVIAASDSEALDAIESGVDEALVMSELTAQSLNNLVDRVVLRGKARQNDEELTTKVAHTEKLAALGTLVAGVAHEVNNPLAALTLCAESLRMYVEPLLKSGEELRRMMDNNRMPTRREIEGMLYELEMAGPASEGDAIIADIISATDAVTRVVGDLKVFARSSEEEARRPVDVVQVAEQVLRLVEREVTDTGAILERDFAADLPLVLIPRTRIAQVITNVVINATHAIREVERDVHRVRVSIRADDEAVAICVRDTGPGIEADAVERIFDPFFTTKRENMGSGLGLSISRSILRRLGGDLIVESVHGKGAEFVAIIPLPDPDELREALSSLRPGRLEPMERLSILLVDEDERVLRGYSRALGRSHNVILACDGGEATDLIASGSQPDIVISELTLPDVDGRSLYEWLGTNHEVLSRRMIFVTNSEQTTPYSEFLETIDNPVLAKPVRRHQLLELIASQVRIN